MRSLNSFANHVGSLATQTVETGTHRSHCLIFGCTGRSVSANPTKLLLRNPALLSTGRGYPDSARTTSVNNSQAPLSFQLKHIAVGNQLSSKWINDFDYIVSQNEFGFNPKKVNNNTENEAERQITGDLKIVAHNPKTVHGKKDNKQVSSTGPSKVAFRSKGFIHVLSIAGETK